MEGNTCLQNIGSTYNPKKIIIKHYLFLNFFPIFKILHLITNELHIKKKKNTNLFFIYIRICKFDLNNFI